MPSSTAVLPITSSREKPVIFRNASLTFRYVPSDEAGDRGRLRIEVKDRLEPPLGRAQRLLGPPAIVHVEGRGHPARDGAGLVADGRDARRVAAIGARPWSGSGTRSRTGSRSRARCAKLPLHLGPIVGVHGDAAPPCRGATPPRLRPVSSIQRSFTHSRRPCGVAGPDDLRQRVGELPVLGVAGCERGQRSTRGEAIALRNVYRLTPAVNKLSGQRCLEDRGAPGSPRWRRWRLRLRAAPTRARAWPSRSSRSSYSELRHVRARLGDEQGGQAHHPVGRLPRRHAPADRAQAFLQHRRDVAHRHEVARDREEALAGGGGMHHRAQVQVGDVAHIDDAERQPAATPGSRRPSGAARAGSSGDSRARAPDRGRPPG